MVSNKRLQEIVQENAAYARSTGYEESAKVYDRKLAALQAQNAQQGQPTDTGAKPDTDAASQ